QPGQGTALRHGALRPPPGIGVRNHVGAAPERAEARVLRGLAARAPAFRQAAKSAGNPIENAGGNPILSAGCLYEGAAYRRVHGQMSDGFYKPADLPPGVEGIHAGSPAFSLGTPFSPVKAGPGKSDDDDADGRNRGRGSNNGTGAGTGVATKS